MIWIIAFLCDPLEVFRIAYGQVRLFIKRKRQPRCIFCSREAADWTRGPLCEMHFHEVSAL